MGGIKTRMEEEYEDTIRNYPIYIEVSDGDGTSTGGLEIGESYLAQFTDPDALWSLSGYVEDVKLRRTLDVMGAETPPVSAQLVTLGWHEHIPYIATDYNAGVTWRRPGAGSGGYPDVVTEAYPDPDVYIEPLEWVDEDKYGFYYGIENEDGTWTTELLWNILISEDLLEYVENGMLSFSIVQRMGPNTRIHPFVRPVSAVVKGSNASMIFADWEFHRHVQWTMGQYGIAALSGTMYLLPDETIMTRASNYEVSIVPDTPVVGTLTGITSFDAADALNPDLGVKIAIYDGYDESILRTDENVALVSEDVLDWAEDGELFIAVRSRTNAISDPEAQLKIIGTVSGAGEGLVFAPFSMVSQLGVESDERRPYTEIMNAMLSDNRDLVSFKQAAVRTFKDVGIFFNVQVFSMTIYDSVFYGITEALMQTIFFIDIATPFVYLIAICIGFVASFLLTRRRKGEFAMMRSVGVSKTGIFIGALFEQTMLCAIGVALGFVVFALTWDYMFIERSLAFLGCYMLGAAISAARAAGTDVLRLLRDKE